MAHIHTKRPVNVQTQLRMYAFACAVPNSGQKNQQEKITGKAERDVCQHRKAGLNTVRASSWRIILVCKNLAFIENLFKNGRSRWGNTEGPELDSDGDDLMG